MAITFAGQNCLLESGPVAEFFDCAFPRDWRGEHAPPLTQPPYFNYPWPPLLQSQLRIGDLFWPTGAQRFAQCWIVVDADTLDTIEATLPDTGLGSLVLDDDSPGSVTPAITAQMYMLQPRQLSGSGDRWLIPLVDQRYWWQFQSTGSLAVSQGSTTWADVIASLMTALNVTNSTTSAIQDAYLYPDSETIAQFQGNPAALLDAVAASIGMRVVAGLDGSVKVQDTLDGLTALQINQGTPWTLQAGGEFDFTARAIPGAVSVAFRERNFSTGEVRGIYPLANGPGSAFPDTTTLPTIKRIRSTCYADVTIAGFGNTPDNATALTALAAQIATDYYASIAQGYEYKFNSQVDWQPCFFDDYVIWSLGALERGTGNRLAGARVKSLPLNWGPDTQLQQQAKPSPSLGSFYAQLSTLQQVSSGDTAGIAFDTTVYSAGSQWSLNPSTGELTISKAGYFSVTWNVAIFAVFPPTDPFLMSSVVMQLKPSGGMYAPIEGTAARPYAYKQGSGASEPITASLTFQQQVAAGDTYQLSITNGSLTDGLNVLGFGSGDQAASWSWVPVEVPMTPEPWQWVQ